MSRIIPDDITAYAEAHSTAVPELYERLDWETREGTELPQMLVGHLEGRLLKLLAQLSGARNAIEIGTFTGYSALCIAEGLPEGGQLITCDINETTTGIARRYFDEAPWGHKIRFRLGDARETVRSIDGPLDFAFIDADKESYIDYWEALVPKMGPGALLVVDNVLWGGSVLEPSRESDHAIVAFNDHVAKDERTEQVMLTVRDGITVARKRG